MLIGLPGSGKTAVGRLVAQLLHTRFVDVDEVIVAGEGQTVAEIFAERGEPAFRELERSTVQQLLQEAPCVIAPGGGWAAQPQTMADAATAMLVYLDTEPDEAAQRVANCESRPLLTGADANARVRALWETRRAFYERAGHTVTTTGRSVEDVAQRVAMLARKAGGW